MLITLTTDFGLRDGYPGVMKGVMAGINPEAVFIDLSHEIGPGNIREAACLLRNSCRWFPQGTIHLAVVDPGVGSGRRALIMRSGGYYFVGPDNGIFTGFFQEAKRVVSITEQKFTFPSIEGRTFDGRDVFAPAAAWLSKGGFEMREFGPELKVEHLVRLPLPEAAMEDGRIRGEIVHIDRFGNCITNIGAGLLAKLKAQKAGPLRAEIKGQTLGMVNFYAEGAGGLPHAVADSNGFLEIFIYMGNARSKLNAGVGDPVEVF
ncbi:MAG: SAM-dependent chlorinase/fluorinase [Nitrospiraceae bacterium]|nr:SAM-dependent chlorinase/fluorinase [Nitrospiraceae bacterium]